MSTDYKYRMLNKCSTAAGSIGIVRFATTEKSYSSLLFVWCLAARNQSSFAQLKANGRVTCIIVNRTG